jgi:uncharacterized damage-inducible protein DinB
MEMNGMRLAEEIESELTLCRRIFERLPSDMLGWRPHERSPNTGALAAHIADMVEWIKLAATTEELDYATKTQISVEPSTTDELLRYFDACASGAAASVREMSSDALQETWTVRNARRVFISRPREHVIRVDCLYHIIHHRGQLTIYCRLKDIKLPGVYGPDDDE